MLLSAATRLARLLVALTLSLPLVATGPGHVLAEGSGRVAIKAIYAWLTALRFVLA